MYLDLSRFDGEVRLAAEGNGTVHGSLYGVLEAVANRFSQLADNPVEILNLANHIKANSESWADAVVVGTPGYPAARRADRNDPFTTLTDEQRGGRGGFDPRVGPGHLNDAERTAGGPGYDPRALDARDARGNRDDQGNLVNPAPGKLNSEERANPAARVHPAGQSGPFPTLDSPVVQPAPVHAAETAEARRIREGQPGFVNPTETVEDRWAREDKERREGLNRP